MTTPEDNPNPDFPKGPAAKSGDRGWAERLANEFIRDKGLVFMGTKTMGRHYKEAFMAGYAARMLDEGAQPGNDDWPYFPPGWAGSRSKTCELDGYLEIGDKGDEQYWHCEEPAVAQLNDLWLCSGHITQEIEGEPFLPIQPGDQ